MSTRGSASPPSTDGKPSPSSTASSSPGSGCGSVTSPEQDGPSVKKKARTNYRPDQVKALERQFHENPYPDAEMMETLSQNLEIPENKIKVCTFILEINGRKKNTFPYANSEDPDQTASAVRRHILQVLFIVSTYSGPSLQRQHLFLKMLPL